MALAQDKNSHVYHSVYRPRYGLAQQISFNGTAAKATNDFDPLTQVISLYASQPCYFELIDQDSEAVASTSSNYLPSGVRWEFSLGGKNDIRAVNISVLEASSGGTLYITEMN